MAEVDEVDCRGREERRGDDESVVRDELSCVDRYCTWFQLQPCLVLVTEDKI